MITVHRAQFRYLLLLQIVCFITLAALPFVMGPFLTPEDRAIYEYVPETLTLSPIAIAVSFLLLPIALWALQNFYALFTFKSYAPKHLLYITIIGLVAALLVDPLGVYQYTGLESLILSLYGMVQGATLTLAFASNIATEFGRTTQPEYTSGITQS